MSLKSALQWVFQKTFENLWSVGFHAFGRRWRSQLQHQDPLSSNSTGAQRVLVIAPHPDDEVAGCVGAILAHRRCGDRVLICVATDGRRSRALGLNSEEMAKARRAEIDAAVDALDVELNWFGLSEGEWSIEVLVDRFLDVLERFQPTVVYAPSRVDFHPEHENVARSLSGALARVGNWPQDLTLRIYAVQVPLTPRLANLFVPVDLEDSALASALRAHHSQRGSLERCLRRRRYAGRLYRSTSAVETFWQMTSTQYQRLHAQAPAQPLHLTFRGLRYYAWSDPLAYFQGRSERRRLAELADS